MIDPIRDELVALLGEIKDPKAYAILKKRVMELYAHSEKHWVKDSRARYIIRRKEGGSTSIVPRGPKLTVIPSSPQSNTGLELAYE